MRNENDIVEDIITGLVAMLFGFMVVVGGLQYALQRFNVAGGQTCDWDRTDCPDTNYFGMAPVPVQSRDWDL